MLANIAVINHQLASCSTLRVTESQGEHHQSLKLDFFSNFGNWGIHKSHMCLCFKLCCDKKPLTLLNWFLIKRKPYWI